MGRSFEEIAPTFPWQRHRPSCRGDPEGGGVGAWGHTSCSFLGGTAQRLRTHQGQEASQLFSPPRCILWRGEFSPQPWAVLKLHSSHSPLLPVSHCRSTVWIAALCGRQAGKSETVSTPHSTACHSCASFRAAARPQHSDRRLRIR